MNDSPVLIVGAGPTGLALALFLARNGVKPRLIEKSAGHGQASRAMVVQARTLEFYRQLGFADDVVARGIPMRALHLREGRREVAEIPFGDFGQGLSPYPFILSFPQDDHERLLGERLQAAGVAVEWGTELLELRDGGDSVLATLRRADGAEETLQAAYLCGCDGAHSAVRQHLQLGFPGGTYDQNFYVADVEAAGDAAVPDGLSMCLSTDAFGLVFPIRSSGMSRLIGIVPNELRGRPALTFDDLRPSIEKQTALQVRTVNWFSTYRVHHRVAERFRRGRVFIAGDAGHIHSPAGGQGMNTGIGDAVNLAWKLAAVLRGRADPSLLDTYEAERIAFARSLVATTDQMFQLMVGRGVRGQAARELLMPHLAPFLMGFAGVRTAAFKFVSQIRVNYHGSALSAGAAGDVHGGDRLPWVPGEGGDNFEPLRSCDWQAHVYGDTGPALRDAAREARLALHCFPWTEGAHGAGLKRDALYLVRPDGYVALADAGPDVEAPQQFLSRFGIAPRPDSV